MPLSLPLEPRWQTGLTFNNWYAIYLLLTLAFLPSTHHSQSVSQSLARNLFLCSVQVGRKVFRSFESPLFYLLAQWWWFSFPSLSFALFYLHYHHATLVGNIYIDYCANARLFNCRQTDSWMAYRTVVYSAALWSTLSLSLRASLPLSLLCFSVPVSQSSTLSISFYFYSFLWKFYEKKRIYPSSVDSFSRFCPLFHFGPVFGGYCF